jgi:carbon-monoxide dehydrogenase medium subunit
MQPFDYIAPQDYAEASALLADGDAAARAFMGGTDLLIRLRSGLVQPRRVVDLKALPGLREIRLSDSRPPAASAAWLVIGAACTMNQVATHPLVRRDYGLLAQACNAVASYQLRNRATIGGNCCNASPAADTAPALYCLGAMAEVYGPGGSRRIPIAEFFVGPGKTTLQKGEFLTAIHLPPPPAAAIGVFDKLGRTKVGDIALVSVAVYCWMKRPDRSSETCQVCWRIALGAVGPTPLRAREAEDALAADSSAAGTKRAAELAAAAARPIDDLRASAAYRRDMVRVLTRRAIENVLMLRAGSDARSPAGDQPSLPGGAA